VIGKTYDIHYGTGKPLGKDDIGDFDPAEQRITIRTGQKIETEQDTLLHEVLHAIDSELNLNTSEEQIAGLATGLLAVLKDNPKFYSYLRRKK
jgi:hypothetical protein